MPVQGIAIEQLNNVVTATFADREMTVPVMREVISELMQKMRYDNAQFFVLDLKAVEFLSSGCLGAMVEFLQDLQPIKGRMALANCRENVAFLFKVTRLDAVFRLFDDVQTAAAEVVHR